MTKKQVKYAFIDADPIAYAAACICEKVNYKWVKKDGSEESEVFKNAKDAKTFMVTLEMSGEDPSDWTRESIVQYLEESEAKKAVEGVMNDYMNTAKKLTDNPDITFKGWLTDSSVRKTKDIGGLEIKYQGNRDPSKKPLLLPFCREYLQIKYPFIKMAAKGFEADTHVVYNCEKHGDAAVGLFIDKDLAQMENAQYIDMKDPFKRRHLVKTTDVGSLYFVEDVKGRKHLKGNGFMWLVTQAMIGDVADNYKGLNGFGSVSAYELFKDCTSKKEIMEKAYAVYLEKLKDGTMDNSAEVRGATPQPGYHLYLSWDGKRVKLNAKQLFNQHLFLAYQERGSESSLKVEDFLDV